MASRQPGAPARKSNQGTVLALVLVGVLALPVLACLGIGGAVYWYVSRSAESLQAVASGEAAAAASAGTLVLQWPQAEREHAVLSLDGRLEPYPKTGELKFVLSPGTHRVLIRRRGFEPFEAEVALAPGAVQRVVPQWRSALVPAAVAGALPPPTLPSGAIPSSLPAGLPSLPIGGATSIAARPELQYVSDGFIGAVVLHPQRILQSPLLRPLATDDALEEAAAQGIDPRLVRQVVVLVSDPAAAGGARLPAAVVRFSQPVNGTEQLGKFLEASELRREGGLSFLVSPNGMLGGFQPDRATLVVGPPELLPGMAAARNVRTPLTELIGKVNLGKDAAGGFVMTEGMRGPADSLIEALRQSAPGGHPMPAPVSSAAQGLPGRLQAVRFAADLRDQQLLELSAAGSDAQAAGDLQTVARYVLNLIHGQLASAPGLMLPPEMEAPFKPLAANLIKEAKFQQRGAELVVSFARPQGLDAAVAALAARQARARQPADRASNLRSIGIGMQNHHDTFYSLPPALGLPKEQCDRDGRPLLSWRVHLLPFIEQKPLYDQFHLNEPWDSPHNLQLLDKMPPLFRTTPDPTKTTVVVLHGNGALYDDDQKGPSLRGVNDGTSRTLMVVEAGQDKAVPWTRPENSQFDPANPKSALGAIAGDFFYAVLADGTVVRLAADLPADAFKALATKAGREGSI